MASLKVVHKPPGYEAWKDETSIPKPHVWVIVGIILGSVVVCGVVPTSAVFIYMRVSNQQEPPLPTLAVIEAIPTSTLSTLVLVDAQPTPQPPPPTQTPPPPLESPTPDMQATLDYLVAQRDQSLQALPTTAPQATAIPVWCNGAEFDSYPVNQVLKVTMQDKGALRLLDRPRVTGEMEPVSQKLLYDGWMLRITGDPVCGAWNGTPIAYFPVYSFHWEMDGWVGFGQSGDIWLEPAGVDDAQ